jgi:hypothetical protein
MKEFNLVFRHQPELFEKKLIKCNKIECIVESKNFKGAVRKAKDKLKNEPLLKGFMFLGLQVVKLLIIAVLLSGCYSVKQWQMKQKNPCNQYLNNRTKFVEPAKFI